MLSLGKNHEGCNSFFTCIKLETHFKAMAQSYITCLKMLTGSKVIRDLEIRAVATFFHGKV